jgi:hypothetical protein
LDALIRQLLPDHPLEAAQVALRAWGATTNRVT